MAKMLRMQIVVKAGDMVTPENPEDAFGFDATLNYSNVTSDDLHAVETMLCNGLLAMGAPKAPPTA